jgi:hypothetical protein
MFLFAVVIALLYLKAIAREKFLSGLALSDFDKKLFKKYELKNLDKELELRKKYCGFLDKEREDD